MACANRAEIVRKAILNCSTDIFDQSHSFVFHILSNEQIKISIIQSLLVILHSCSSRSNSYIKWFNITICNIYYK